MSYEEAIELIYASELFLEINKSESIYDGSSSRLALISSATDKMCDELLSVGPSPEGIKTEI